jgi:hypothetical protein
MKRSLRHLHYYSSMTRLYEHFKHNSVKIYHNNIRYLRVVRVNSMQSCVKVLTNHFNCYTLDSQAKKIDIKYSSVMHIYSFSLM